MPNDTQHDKNASNERPSLPEIDVQPLYESVVLGHPYSAVDRDQILAAYFAIKLGVVPSDSSFSFSPFVEDAQLQDPKP